MDTTAKTEWCTMEMHDDSISVIEVNKKGNEVAHLCMERDEAIAAARAILKHFNATLESDQ